MMIPRHIFREYDIRGIAEGELTDEAARLIGQAFGSFLAREKKKKPEAKQRVVRGAAKPETQRSRVKGKRPRVAVAQDLRPSSERIQKALERGLTQAGIDLVDLGLVPTPLLYFAIVHFSLDAGISITGSHNPPEYNGFKFQLHERPFYGRDLQSLREAMERMITGVREIKGAGDRREKEKAGGGRIEKRDIVTPYLDLFKKQFHFKKKWKVVIDSGHGMAGLVAPRLFKELGQEVIELYSNLDPAFPDHHPDPSVPENMKDLSQKVRETQASIGIAFDGDADRIGVVDELGEIISNDRLLILYARAILKKKKGAAIIGDVKCSPLLYQDIAQKGGRAILWKTGHSLIKAKMKEEKALLGGELSGHMFFRDRWYGFDDAIYAACRIVEILDEAPRPLSELTADLPKMFSTPEIRLEAANDEKKFAIVRAVVADLKKEKNYKVIDLDGARIEFPDGFGLIRASNTQPALVMRFEARSEARLAEIRRLIEGKIKKFA